MPGVTDYLGLLLPTLEEYFDEENHVNTNMQIINDAFKTKVPAVTTKDITLYVATTGSDMTGDGTVIKPYATITKAISVIPQVVNHTVTVNVAAGTYAEDIALSGYTGKGYIQILGATSIATTHNVAKIKVSRCGNAVVVKGFNITTTTDTGMYVAQSPHVFCSWINMVTSALSYVGVLAEAGGHLYISTSTISNRNVAIEADYNAMVAARMIGGANNNVAFWSASGILYKKDGNTITAVTMDGYSEGGIVLNSNGSTANKGIASCTTADLTLYVDGTNGNDANAGTSSGTGAKKTIQAAINSLPQIINHNVAINVAAGTYNELVNILGFSGKGILTLQGAASQTNTHKITNLTINNSTNITINGFQFLNTTGASITTQNVANCSINNCTLDSACAYGVYADRRSQVFITTSLISNKTSYALGAIGGSVLVSLNNSGVSNVSVFYATGGTIQKSGTTQPAGTTIDNIDTYWGGLIINSDGTLGGAVGSSMMGNGSPLSATTGAVTVPMDGSRKNIIPTGSCVLNATGGFAGQKCSIEIVTSGTTSYLITFGSNFRSTGTVSTGTVSAKIIIVSFVYDGLTWIETGRTGTF